MLFQRRLLLELMGNALTTAVLLIAILSLISVVGVLQTVEGLSAGIFFKLVPILVATSLDLVVPMAALVAVVLTYGRAAAENEIDTLRACGVRPLHVFTPGVVFGLLLTALLVFGLDQAKPHAERAKRLLTKDVDVAELVAHKLASGEPEYIDDRTLVSAGGIDEAGNAVDLRVLFLDDDGRVEREIVAPTAVTYVDRTASELVMKLPRFRTVKGSRFDGAVILRKQLRRDEANLNMASMTTGQLVAWLERPGKLRGAFEESHVRTEVHMRLSAAATCLVFVVLGIPVALRFRRNDRVGAFMLAFLLALFLYYPSVKVSKALAEEEVLPAWVAAWAGHAALLAVSGLVSRRMLYR